MESKHSPFTGSYVIFRLILLLVLLAFGNKLAYANNPHHYDRAISEIRVYGNETTQSRFILKWANLRPGELLTREKLKLARQNILDTSLFKEVTIKTKAVEDQVRVAINLEEKRFTLLLPRLGRNSNGDVKAGLKLRMHNIAGANQTLNMLVEQTDLSNGDDNERYRIDYKLPQYSQPYYYKWKIGQSIKNTEEDGFKNTEYSDFISFSVARDLQTGLFVLPVTLSTIITLQRVDLDQPYPVAFNEIEAGNFNRLGIEVEYDNVHQQRFRRHGRYFSLSYQQGFGELESDHISRILEFESNIFRPISSRDNINSRFFIGLAQDSPFNSPYYDLGGADNIRGLERDIFSGEALVFANIEYIKGYADYPSFRNSFFFDIGNVYDDASSIDLGDVYHAVGVGFRWKLTSFIKTDLFVDVAYEPDNEETRVYGGTSLSF